MASIATVSLTIASGAATSSAFSVGEYLRGSVQIPGSISGTTLATHVSNDGTNFTALQDAAGNTLTVSPMSANEAILIRPEAFNFKFARFVSSGNEGADRTLAVTLFGE